jgi:heat shock protein HtpX
MSFTQKCPQCGTIVPSDPRYVTWCDHCDWNVVPQQPERPRAVFPAMYVSMGERWGQRLYQSLRSREGHPSSLTATRLLALLCSLFVHAITFVLATVGLVLLIHGWTYPVTLILGLFLLGAAVVVRPRGATMPERILPRKQYPALYKLADDVAMALGTRPVYGIVADANFNAGFSQVGLRRRSIVSLGLPLFSVLDEQERVALLAHELAHGVNGDPARGFLVGSAINSLARWHFLLQPDRGVMVGSGTVAAASAIANVISLLLSQIPRFGAYILSHLLWRDSQRAEYLADRLAMEVSGSAAALSTLDKLHLAPQYAHAVRTVAMSRQPLDLFEELHKLVGEMPERERERIRRVERLEGSRLDSTHPPTAFRIDLLQSYPVAAPRVVLGRAESQAMDKELGRLHKAVQTAMVNRYQNSLYY